MNFSLRLVAVIGILTAPLCAFSQSNYKPGYIIKASGDTLKGYINYQEWDRSPKAVEFKLNVTDNTPQRFRPAVLRGFAVNGMDQYVSYAGPLSMDKNVFSNLPSELDTTTVQDTVFLQVRYQGNPLTLLKHQDVIKTRFFVLEKDVRPVELKYHLYYKDANTTRSVDLYKATLLALAQKYNAPNAEQLELEINRANFREGDLNATLKNINNDKAIIKSGASGGRFFAGIALNQTVTDFKGTNPLSNQSVTSTSPRLSAGFDLFLNKYTQRLIFRTELAVWQSKPRFSTERKSDLISSTIQYEYSFTQTNTAVIPQVICNVYNQDKFKVYVGAGLGLNFSFYSNNQYIERTIPSYGIPDKSSSYNLEKFWFSIPLQAGFVFNRKLEVFAAYAPPSSITQYSLFSISNATRSAGVRYLFK